MYFETLGKGEVVKRTELRKVGVNERPRNIWWRHSGRLVCFEKGGTGTLSARSHFIKTDPKCFPCQTAAHRRHAKDVRSGSSSGRSRDLSVLARPNPGSGCRKQTRKTSTRQRHVRCVQLQDLQIKQSKLHLCTKIL